MLIKPGFPYLTLPNFLHSSNHLQSQQSFMCIFNWKKIQFLVFSRCKCTKSKFLGFETKFKYFTLYIKRNQSRMITSTASSDCLLVFDQDHIKSISLAPDYLDVQ